MTDPTSGRRAGRTIAIAMLSTVVSVLPVFLVGALAVDIALDLDISPTGIGASVAAFRLGAAVTSRPLGRFADAHGAHFALRSALALAGVTSLFMAVFVRGLPALLVTLAIGGAAQALAQPAANRMLANGVSGDRLGRAFGVKQAAPPLASMLAGASVPLLATQFDWRVVYLMVPLLVLPVVVVLGRDVPWEVHVPAGFSRPSDAIVNVVERISADLLVIGMRRRSRVGKAVLGSNAVDILMQVECAVLSVPAPEDANW